VARRKRKFTYSLSKTQLQLVIEALLMARSAGAHAEVVVIAETGEEHRFDGIVSDGTIDNLLEKFDDKGVGYDVQLMPTGRPYTKSEDKSIEVTINALNDSLGEIEAAEEAEAEKAAADAVPDLIDQIYKFLGEKSPE
jgi:hypothetical protein